MYKKRFDKTGRRIMSVVLAAVMAVPLLTGETAKDMSKVQAATSLKNPSIGSNGVATWDCVYFGRYPQSDATGKKSDPIKWRVLSVNGNDAFLMADCNLDVQKYHDKQAEVTWETCTVRSWLNGYGSGSNASSVDYSKSNFINKAFTASEQSVILSTPVTSMYKIDDKEAGTKNVTDKIFLLSFEEVTNPAYGFSSNIMNVTQNSDGEEVQEYIPDPAKERLKTAYVSSLEAPLLKPEDKNGIWWLRSPKYKREMYYYKQAMYVSSKGDTYQDGNDVTNRFAICPALHLNLSDTKLWSYAGTVSSDGSSTTGEVPPTIEIPMEESKTGIEYVTKDEPGSSEKTVEYSKAPEDLSGNVVIPETVVIKGVTYTVTSVADNAFKNNKKIKKVVIGNNVKVIGENAFMGCSNLQSVTIGKNVTTIKARAFYKCTKLTKITIPSKVNKIGKQEFYGCKKLKTITIKTTKLSSKNVGSKAFKGIHSKATIKVPKKKLSAYKKMLKSKGVGSKAKIKK